jgi:tetratricopeptide (TPR) repeat protein
MKRFASFLSQASRLIVVGVIAFSTVGTAFAQSGQTRFATLESWRGRASVVRLGNALTLQRGMALQRNDVVVTRDGSLVLRFYSDGSSLRVGPNSRIQINESAGERDIEVFGGRLWARVVSWKERPMRFRTGRTIAAVRGTELAIDFDEETTLVSVLEGEVFTENDEGSLTVSPGEMAVVEPGKAPAMRVVARPQDSVQWALYFQPVVYALPADIAEDESWQRAIQQSMESYGQGDLEDALDVIGAVIDDDIDDSRFFAYRASLSLAASNVDKAAADIERSLELKPNDTQALALQTIIAVAQNDSEKALATAEKTVASDPNSATGQIATSYARQSVFDLEGARDALERAVALDTDNALAWARLAELQLSFGKLSDALSAARTAATHDPNLNRTQTVLGYAYLAQVKTGKAIEAFEKAIELDQGDPMPRLGLGLAKIRNGDLDGGIKELEVAASLDPGSSLARSYLGKAYYERKRTGVDAREYELAKQLDPNDPTPWFYDAIAKQTINQPVEALHDMEQAIELNDSRGVYRSRLLLDSDLAARNASLGRIYSDLGFQQLALVEGWNSVNIDPTNFSAHRLLSDSLAVQPRQEISRVSSLLMSQLLQPLNTTPIQPRMAESNLFLISAQGPAALGANEFNVLFNRDQVNVQLAGSAGEDDTFSGMAMVSGIYKKFSFSLGYEHFETEGWRENSDQEDEIIDAFFQFELSPKTSLQAELRQREKETGDLEMRFWEGDYRPELRETTDQTSGRLGLRHSFSPSSILLLSYIHQDKEIDFSDGFDLLSGTLSTALDQEEKADSFEGQYIYRSPSRNRSDRGFNLIAGAGYFDIDYDGTFTAVIDFPPPPFGPGPIEEATPFETTTKHSNAYAYGNITLRGDLTFTLGVSADRLEEDLGIGEKDQVNPKFGIIWRPWPKTTLRGAYFETLKRTLVTDQTLEPTQVAGFTQFYDDPSATSTKVFGAAIDQKVSKSVFLGLEYTERELEIPTLFFDFEIFDFIFIDLPQDEKLARAYLFATPHRWWALRAEYRYEMLEHDPLLQLGFEEVTTHKVPLGLQFIHPSGLSAMAGATYLKQDGSFELRVPPFGYAPGETDFWVFDAGLRYRLPKRYGFITVGVNNLTDEYFSYFASESMLPSNARNLSLRPGRLWYARVVLAFP